jgi:NADH dehydrogenase [ubiquinone] 1 alpha subcomplex assembly factor 1
MRKATAGSVALLSFLAASRATVGMTQPWILGPWNVVNDNVMGGLSTSVMRMPSDSSSDNQRAVIFEGTVRTENNGGFASVRCVAAEALPLPVGSSVVMRVRGDGKRYTLRVLPVRGPRTDDSVWYTASFQTAPGLEQEIRVDVRKMVPKWRGSVVAGMPQLDTTAGICGVGLMLVKDGGVGRFRFELLSLTTGDSSLIREASGVDVLICA